MYKTRSTTILIFSWILFVGSNVLFNHLYLYLYFDWLDIFMHIWGGILIMYSWYYVHSKGRFQELSVKVRLHPVLFLLLVIFGWEIFRYLTKTIVVENYATDTVVDLLVGFVGGFITYLWLSSRIKNREL